jgi:hypothetical protein
VATAAALALAATPVAVAATSKSKSWQVVAGHFKTKSAATAEVTKLSGKGLTGYKIEIEKAGQFSSGKKYEVEKGYSSQKAATTAMKTAKRDAKGATLEHESNN